MSNSFPTVEALIPPNAVTVVAALATLIFVSVFWTVLKQVLFKNPNEPPIVFYWVPIVGSAIGYGMDPYKFFTDCQAKYGDVFTFILFGRKTTVYLGQKGNDFILNGKLKDVNAEEIYNVLTAPVFGSGVIYDCPNSKLMEQKKFIKFGLTSEALQSYVPLIESEVYKYIKKAPAFQGSSGQINIPPVMAEIVIFTASRCLQGEEVREKLDSTFADMYHDLDMGFTPINFMLPWAPLPHNKKRDAAQRKMTQTYVDIMKARREKPDSKKSHEQDALWNLMRSVYKDGTPVPDKEIAHMMIALLMAGQHSSSVTSSWIMLELAAQPNLMEELYQEQIQVLGDTSKALSLEDIQKLKLNANIVKETLRLHPPIHSLMRKVKNPLPVEGTHYVIPPSHVVLAAPGFMSKSAEYFPEPEKWDPHRWDNIVEAEDEKVELIDYGYGPVSAGTTSTYLPFGAGRHRCIGEKFAYLQLTTVMAIMVREFKLKSVPGKAVPATDYSSLFSRPMWPAEILWEKRHKSVVAGLEATERAAHGEI